MTGETQVIFFLCCTTNVQDFSPGNIAHIVCPLAAVVLCKSHYGFGTFCCAVNLKHHLDSMLSEVATLL